MRQVALWELHRQLPRGGAAVLHRSIQSETHESPVIHALFGTMEYARRRDVHPNRRTLEAMRDIACDTGNRPLTRGTAVHVLARSGGRGLKRVLIEAAERSPDRGAQVEARIGLLRFGHVPSKRALLEAIRSDPADPGPAYDLWRHRDLFRWRPSEDAELNAAMERLYERFRRRLYDSRFRIGMRGGAVRRLIWLAELGFEFAPEDVQQARRVAAMSSDGQRRDLREMLRELERSKRRRRARR